MIIDYRREDGRFPVSASCVTISNSDSIFTSETIRSSGVMIMAYRCDDEKKKILESGQLLGIIA
jgi:hypothetical protein